MVSSTNLRNVRVGGGGRGSSVEGRPSRTRTPIVMSPSCLLLACALLPTTVAAGAAVPQSDAAAYIYQQKQQLDQPSAKSREGGGTTTTPSRYGTSSPFSISSRLSDAVGSSRSVLKPKLRHRIAASSPQAHYFDDLVQTVAASSTSTIERSYPAAATTASTKLESASTPLSPNSPTATTATTATAGLSPKAIFFMALLALQFGLQPILVRRFTPASINKSTVVFTQEIIKLVISLYVYLGSTTREQQRTDWGDGGRPRLLARQLAVAGLPAALYCVQNLVSLLAYQNLDPVAFNVLNQTKTLSAALCCYLVLGSRQSGVQIMALGLLLGAALVLEKILPVSMLLPGLAGGAASGAATVASAATGATGIGSGIGSAGLVATLGNMVTSLTSGGMARRVTHGVLPILLASFLSGLAGALVQKAVQGGGRQMRRVREGKAAAMVKPKNFYLFSTELGIASIFLLLVSFAFSGDGRRIASHGFFHGWTPATLLPILTQSFGGICVGLVTKYAGSVRKGFALIFGMLLSGMVTARGGGLGVEQMVGLILASASLFLHTRYPYRKSRALAAA